MNMETQLSKIYGWQQKEFLKFTAIYTDLRNKKNLKQSECAF